MSFSDLSLSFPFKLLHFLYMWAIELSEHFYFVLQLMHTNVTIAAKVTWFLENIRIVGIGNRLSAISSGCLVLRNIINLRVRLHYRVE